jgi:hypothetical protein
MLRLSRTTLLILLPAIAALQQGRYVARAVLPAQDAIDVVSVAQRFERDGIATTLRAEAVSPLFPLLVATTHEAGVSFGLIEARNWAGPPQWVAAAALILAVIPIFLTTDRLAGRTAAVTASLFFIFLPSIARLGADGLGDAVHLCLVAWAVWFWLDERRFVAGLCIAAALLVRAEAAVVPIAVVGLSVVRRDWRAAPFCVAASLCLVPYLAVGITEPMEIAERLRGGAAPTEAVPLNGGVYWMSEGIYWGDDHQRLQSIGRKDRARSSRFVGLAATASEFVDELVQSFGYALLPWVVVGAWAKRKSSSWGDADRLLLSAVGLQFVVLFVVAWRGGYLSTRHFALPVVLTLSYAAIGLNDLCNRIATQFRFEISDLRFQRIAIGAFIAVTLLVTWQPLHESQRPHRLAAAWLDSTDAAPGAVLDQQGFTALYTGRTTYRFEAAAEAFNDALRAYVVVERQDLEADTERGATLRHFLGKVENAVARFPADDGKSRREVLIYAFRTAASLANKRNSDAR